MLVRERDYKAFEIEAIYTEFKQLFQIGDDTPRIVTFDEPMPANGDNSGL